MDFKFEPIDRWPYGGTGTGLKRAPFKTSYPKVLAHLKRELEHLRARNPMLQTGHRPDDIRFDGAPRANARLPKFAGVCLVFQKWQKVESNPHGEYVFIELPCATYDRWEDNLRAIGLTLEALRAVGRYGVKGTGAERAGQTEEAKQYAGFARKKVESRTGVANGPLTPDAAAAVLAANAEGGWTSTSLLQGNLETVEACYRVAAKKAHPDMGGTQHAMVKVNEAISVLRKFFRTA